MYVRFVGSPTATSSANLSITLDLNTNDIVTVILARDGGEDDTGVVINSEGTWLEIVELFAGGTSLDYSVLKGTSGLVQVSHTITGWQSANYQESFPHGFGNEPDWINVVLIQAISFIRC